MNTVKELIQRLDNQVLTPAQQDAALRARAAKFLCQYEGQTGTVKQTFKRMQCPNIVMQAIQRGFKV